ncbi:MAG TPA: phosphatase PAP2 family protein [Actinomycetota bacterium]
MRVRSILKAAALATAALGVGAAALRTQDGAELDAALFTAGNADAGPTADRFFLGVTELGSLYTAGAAAATLTVLGRRTEASRALTAAGVTWLLGQGVKKLVARPRPYEADVEGTRFLIAPPHGTSWPSSHPAVFTAFATVAGRELDLGLFSRGGLTGIGTAVAASRVYVGVHYPSDVVSGFLMGRAVAALWPSRDPR